ncbi:MAG: hypothetical protein LBQ52_10895 [Helicobacteraceae bacterium]|jgi:CRISPR type III-B/RAMP module-associated protein Cmr3|nr:hypothetical protein [Helicobacteraceae bacterium]
MIWYELTPFDTLFFRGSIPLEAGLPVSDILFPPPPSVIAGAIWTAGKQDFSAPPNVKVGAILLKQGEQYYAQAPYSWYASSRKEKEKNALIPITRAKEFNDANAICSVSAPISWIEDKDIKSIGGQWIKIDLFSKSGENSYKKEAFFDEEDRIGIGIDSKRGIVEEGKLFMARHIRLRNGVTIAIAIDKEYGLGEKGTLRLGGEGRSCGYQKIKTPPSLPSGGDSKYFVSLAPILCDNEALLSKVFAAKTFVVAGWDMRKGKGHKDSQTWFCAGSVFTEKIGDQLIALAQ